MLKFDSVSIDLKIRSLIHTIRCQKVKMLCLTIYCLLSSSCGKEVNNNESNGEGVRRPAISASVIKVENTTEEKASYTFNRIGETYLPAKIKYLYGDGAKSIKIYFAKGDPVEEMYCAYSNTDGDADLEFVDCYYDHDNDGNYDEFNYDIESEPSVVLMQEHIIEVVSENDEVAVEAELEVEWH